MGSLSGVRPPACPPERSRVDTLEGARKRRRSMRRHLFHLKADTVLFGSAQLDEQRVRVAVVLETNVVDGVVHEGGATLRVPATARRPTAPFAALLNGHVNI